MDPAETVAGEIGELRSAARVSSEQITELWKTVNTLRDAEADFNTASKIILEKLESFERRANERHERLDRENEMRDRKDSDRDLEIAGIKTRLLTLETEKRFAAAIIKALWAGAGGILVWAAQHMPWFNK